MVMRTVVRSDCAHAPPARAPDRSRFITSQAPTAPLASAAVSASLGSWAGDPGADLGRAAGHQVARSGGHGVGCQAMHGRSLRTPKRQADFLRLLAKGNSVGEAALAIGCQRRTVYDWRASDDEFRLAWDDAVDQATEVIESVLYNQARDGNLLACIFWLKAHKPSVYHRKQVIALGGDPGAPPIGVEHNGEVVHFYMPPNHRDEPEEVESDEPPTIEGNAEDDADAAYAPLSSASKTSESAMQRGQLRIARSTLRSSIWN